MPVPENEDQERFGMLRVSSFLRQYTANKFRGNIREFDIMQYA